MMLRVKQLQRHEMLSAGVSSIRGTLKRLAHKVLFPAVEAFYAGLFSLTGFVFRPRAERLVPAGADRVLVLAPHPDDETLGCGGTLGLHLAAGGQVCIAIVTDGGRSRAGGLQAEAMVALRRQEAEDAISALARCVGTTIGDIGALPTLNLIQLGLPEGTWSVAELVGHLGRLIDALRPTIIYTTSQVDFHPEHLRVAEALAKTLHGQTGKHVDRVRAYQLQVPLTPILANVLSSTEATEECKKAALACYRTQSGSFLWVPRHNHYLRALYRSREPLEAFWEMNTAQFVALHASPLPGPGFRSIRLRPFTDPAAWTVGIRRRRTLLRLASEKRYSRE